MLAQRLADIDAPRRKEGVGHAAANDQVIDLADKRCLSTSSLDETLAPPTTAATGFSRACPAPFPALQARPASSGRHRRAARAPALGRRMGAVRCGKGIVDVEIGVGANRLRQGRVVLFLALPEAGVFKNAMSPSRRMPTDCRTTSPAHRRARTSLRGPAPGPAPRRPPC
jgi:hypothetical protein